MLRNLCFIILIVHLSSCGTIEPVTKYYDPAMLGALTYMPKPLSFDSLKVSNYISGGYIQITTPYTRTGVQDIGNLAQAAFSRAHTFKSINFAYGIDGFTGSYHNTFIESGDLDYFKNKSVYGFQLKTSVNTFITSEFYDFRIIGADFSYSKEYGSFSKFREDIIGRENFYSIPETGLFSAGLSSEIVFRSRKSSDRQYGFKLGFQNTFGNLRYQGFGVQTEKQRSLEASLAIYLQLRKYFLIMEGSRGGRINFGYRF
jgi:hypothetical protein